MAKFIPRQAFSIPGSVPKTYYIGHHASAEQQVVNKLSNISLILECRDFRLPLSTHNPRLERTVAGRQRLVDPKRKHHLDHVVARHVVGTAERGDRNRAQEHVLEEREPIAELQG